MKLKDLVMQVKYEEIEPAIEAVFASYNLECDTWRKENWRKVFDTLCSMEPEKDCDMKLKVVPGDVSGYYDEETLRKHPDYDDCLYSLTATPWRFWLGMEMDEETLKDMSVGDILGNCIYEMTWWGEDEEAIQKNIEERLGNVKEKYEEEKEKEEEEEKDGGKSRKVDEKTQCSNFINTFIPAILPHIADKCDNPEFEQTLREVNCTENGAFCEPIDLKPFGLPLTGIALYYIYIEGACMFGVSTEIDGETTEIVYGWYAPSLKELKTVIESDECQAKIIETLTKQIDDKLD